MKKKKNLLQRRIDRWSTQEWPEDLGEIISHDCELESVAQCQESLRHLKHDPSSCDRCVIYLSIYDALGQPTIQKK